MFSQIRPHLHFKYSEQIYKKENKWKNKSEEQHSVLVVFSVLKSLTSYPFYSPHMYQRKRHRLFYGSGLAEDLTLYLDHRSVV